MTELYIDKQLIVLPETFSITIIDENPFFTKNGQYTYDISLSLLDPINAKIYQHLNRINRKGDIPSNRSAYLVVDNEVVLNGTEVILEYSDTEVKIQLVSGNSELNFLIGGDRRLRELDLGKAVPYRGADIYDIAAKVYRDLDKRYPERNWHLLPYSAGYDDDMVPTPFFYSLPIGNLFRLLHKTNMPGFEQGAMAFAEYFPIHSGQVPQPYLCFIIRKVVEAIGYTLEYNALEDDEIRSQAYIVHGFRTLEFAKMLPDWTVIEFFEELEQWLDAITIVDPYTKTVKLMHKYQSSVENGNKVMLQALDEFTVEYDRENNEIIQNSNIGYDLDDDEYYRYSRISADVRKTADNRDFSNLNIVMMLVQEQPPGENVLGSIFNIFAGSSAGSSFIGYRKEDILSLKKVDSFRSLFNNTESEDVNINMRIIPASFVTSYLRTNEIPQLLTDFWIQIPVAHDYDELLEGGAEFVDNDNNSPSPSITNVQEAIESEFSTEDRKGGGKLRLALYSGQKAAQRKLKHDESPIFSAYYPMPFVEALYETYTKSKVERYMTVNGFVRNPFRLEEMSRDIYNKTEAIDTNKLYKISFINTRIKDLTAIFDINNKEFRCIKIERVITPKGFDKVVKGEFYAYDLTLNI